MARLMQRRGSKPSVSADLNLSAARERKAVAQDAPLAPATEISLTDCEVAIMNLLAEGCLAKEIAEKLGIAATTVNHHLQHAYRKLKARNRFDAVRLFQLRQPPP